uniref:Bravo_FIGEY domain-containing protein n=2 Tax=Macrostomum lignano TaxID=282301 RepID=A0A1I8I3W9_9PLAT
MPNSKVGSLETLVPEQPGDDAEEDSGQLLPSFPAEPQLVTPDDVEGYEMIGPPGELSYQPAPKPEAYTFDPDAGIKTFEQ